jgi:hypothetical protein
MSFCVIDICRSQTDPGDVARADVFPLRFKNARTRDALKLIAEQSGRTMTDVAESAIEHEVALLGADLERRLSEALETVRSYRADADLDAYVEAVEAGERSGMDPARDARAAHDLNALQRPSAEPTAPIDRFGVLAAFRR